MSLSVREDTLGIIVMSSHENYLLNILDLLEPHNGQITLFTTTEFEERIRDSLSSPTELNWVTRNKGESTGSFLERSLKICRAHVDILLSFPIYESFHDFLKFFSTDKGCTTLLMIYNVNKWLGSNLAVTFRVHRYLELVFQRLILNHVDAVVVEYSPIKEYLDTEAGHLNTYAFAPIVFDEYHSSSSQNFVVSIPGYVDVDRRDYGFFLDLLQEHLAPISEDVSVRLLGSPSGPEGEVVIEECRSLEDAGWDVEYYREWITVPEFNRYVRESDVLVSPMRTEITKGPVKEIYGTSKGAGCIGDAVRYGKPLVLPRTYSVPEEVSYMVRQYEDGSGLADILLELFDADDGASERIERVQRDYSVEEQRARFYSMITDAKSKGQR